MGFSTLERPWRGQRVGAEDPLLERPQMPTSCWVKEAAASVSRNDTLHGG